MVAHQGQTETTEAGTDPAYVPDREVFDAYTHQQIWDLVHEQLAPGELGRLAGAWDLAAGSVDTAFDEFARDIARLSGEWSGIAAAEAARAAAALVRAGDDAATVCRTVAQLLAADATAAESVRAAIPAPPGAYLPDPDPAVEAATGPARRTSYNITAATLTAEAQDAMTYRYNPAIPASGDRVPRFPTPAEGSSSAPASAPSSSPAASSPPRNVPALEIPPAPVNPATGGPAAPPTQDGFAPNATSGETAFGEPPTGPGSADPAAPNEARTEPPPATPPALGGQTVSERPDRADPGGGSR
ncbi:hypothetical protein [Nocardia sp. NPDC024068]|uniref:hypothetical protein n=1 Tax=Nocardia sp. NPDC024068 TaxID=3157197 RepID=UPI0033FF2C2A